MSENKVDFEEYENHCQEFEFEYKEHRDFNKNKIVIATIRRRGQVIYTQGTASSPHEALEEIIIRNLYIREHPELYTSQERLIKGIPQA